MIFFSNKNNFQKLLKDKVDDIKLGFESNGYMERLMIEINSNVFNVFCLRGIKRVTLFCLSNVDDISPLGEAEEVTLYNCESISNVSPLSKVPKVYIGGLCNRIRNVSMLGKGVQNLTVDITSYALCDLTGLETIPKLCVTHFNTSNHEGFLDFIEKKINWGKIERPTSIYLTSGKGCKYFNYEYGVFKSNCWEFERY